MAYITIQIDDDTLNLLKQAAMSEGLRRKNYDLSYNDLILEAIDESYGPYLFKQMDEEKDINI